MVTGARFPVLEAGRANDLLASDSVAGNVVLLSSAHSTKS
jgi:hypothetical protein